MVKKLLIGLVAFVIPIIVVFTVYRASANYGPLNFKSITAIIGNSFSRSSGALENVISEFDRIVNGFAAYGSSWVEEGEVVLRHGFKFNTFSAVLELLFGGFSTVIESLYYLLKVIFAVLEF